MSGVEERSALVGREAASVVRVLLTLTGGAAGVLGLVLYAAGGMTDELFVWPVASPVTAALLGAAFLGSVPMLLASATRLLWEELRVVAASAAVVVGGLLAVTLTDLGHTRADGGPVVALVLALAWLAGLAGLSAGALVGAVAQLREPGLPLARTAPLPRWCLPLVALEGSALAGLGAGLTLAPAYWGEVVPWRVDVFDARVIGVWCLALGAALLLALAEDDLVRVRPGLVGLAVIGALGLAGLAWRRADVTWTGWPAPLALVVLAGLVATGLTGLVLERRARSRSHDRLSAAGAS